MECLVSVESNLARINIIVALRTGKLGLFICAPCSFFSFQTLISPFCHFIKSGINGWDLKAEFFHFFPFAAALQTPKLPKIVPENHSLSQAALLWAFFPLSICFFSFLQWRSKQYGCSFRHIYLSSWNVLKNTMLRNEQKIFVSFQ